MDILPSIAEIVGFSLPTDRVFDGVPLSFLQPPSSRVLFIPDQLQELWAMRWNSYKIYFATNPNSDCSGSKGTGFVLHDPPLVFDLSVDPAEATPLTNLTAEFYQTLDNFRNDLHKSIESTFKSTVDWSGNGDVVPCCDSRNELCACLENKVVDPLFFIESGRITTEPPPVVSTTKPPVVPTTIPANTTSAPTNTTIPANDSHSANDTNNTAADSSYNVVDDIGNLIGNVSNVIIASNSSNISSNSTSSVIGIYPSPISSLVPIAVAWLTVLYVADRVRG
eukprot:sb/3467914/